MKTDKLQHSFILLAASLLGAMVSRAIPSGGTPEWLQEKQEILRFLSLVETDDGTGRKVKAIRISGVNLQIVNGLGTTNGAVADFSSIDPGLTKTNGAGNLILGYNEDLGSGFFTPLAVRSGSHNLVGGIGASYSSYGGVVFGRTCHSAGPYATVLGGWSNVANGFASSIIGGGDSQYSSGNRASGDLSTVAGGSSNEANGQFSLIAGGDDNLASGNFSFVGGGLRNKAVQQDSAILGGFDNAASGVRSVICGGAENLTNGNDTKVCGGRSNHADGLYSTVGGGRNRNVDGEYDWAAGSLFEED